MSLVDTHSARTSWEHNPPSLHAPTTNSGGFLNGQYVSPEVSTLMTWGPLQFQVWPMNFHEMDHLTETSWAQKPIAGAATYREWTGENDELRHIRGDLFPYRIGGMTEIELLNMYRLGGIPNLLMGGDGRSLGWFVIEKLLRYHTWISAEGVGQRINFEAIFARVPVPDASVYLASVWETTSTPSNNSSATQPAPGASTRRWWAPWTW